MIRQGGLTHLIKLMLDQSKKFHGHQMELYVQDHVEVEVEMSSLDKSLIGSSIGKLT